MNNRRSYPFYKKYAWGKIKDEKGHVDLYLWFESPEKTYFRFTGANDAHFRSLCEVLGVPVNDVKSIGVYPSSVSSGSASSRSE